MAHAKAHRIREVQRTNFGALDDLSAGVLRCARKACDDPAWVHRATGHKADDF